MKKADSALESAKLLLAAGDVEGAANRLYYAMFHAARAALASVGQAAGGKHSTVIGQFGLHLCKNGPLTPDLGRMLNEAQELRNEGDYDIVAPDRGVVANYVAKAERFVSAVKTVVS